MVETVLRVFAGIVGMGKLIGTLRLVVIMLNGIFALQASEINPFHHSVTPQSILMQSSF